MYIFNMWDRTYQIVEFSARNERLADRQIARRARIDAERYRTHQIGQIYPDGEWQGLITRVDPRDGVMRPQVLRGRTRIAERIGRVVRYENGARIRDHGVYREPNWAEEWRDWDGHVRNHRPEVPIGIDQSEGNWGLEDGDGGRDGVGMGGRDGTLLRTGEGFW
jgi:hypothetical protein